MKYSTVPTSCHRSRMTYRKQARLVRYDLNLWPRLFVAVCEEIRGMVSIRDIEDSELSRDPSVAITEKKNYQIVPRVKLNENI